MRRLEEKEQLVVQHAYRMENLEWMLYEKDRVVETLRKYIEKKVGIHHSRGIGMTQTQCWICCSKLVWDVASLLTLLGTLRVDGKESSRV